MTEHNAHGVRVQTRPLWQIVLFMFLTGSIYRIYWMWRVNTDLRDFAGPRFFEPPSPARPVTVNPVIAALAITSGFVGWILFMVAVLPWGLFYAVQEYDGEVLMSTTERLICAGMGIGFFIPAWISLVRLRRRIAQVRTLAGLTPNTKWTRPITFWPLVAVEVVAAPVWLFALQQSVNDLWSHYPALLNEDLHGELAPPQKKQERVALRPELHMERLNSVAKELEHPRRTPIITIAFLMICIVAFGIQIGYHGFFPTTDELEDIGGLKANIDGMWWKFWTANVLHGSVEHIVGNMLIWTMIGTMLERVIGSVRMAALIVIGAAGCSIGALISEPDIVGIGASGVVFAAFGCAAMIDPLAKRSIGKFGWVLSIAGLGMSTFVEGTSSGGHVGGIIAGVVFGAFLMFVWKFKRPAQRIEPAVLISPVLHLDAPLAPRMNQSAEERLSHLQQQLELGVINESMYQRLEAALLVRG